MTLRRHALTGLINRQEDVPSSAGWESITAAFEEIYPGRLGQKAYPIEIEQDGEYFIQVTHLVSSSESYLLSVGAPSYLGASCTVNLGEITMDEKYKTFPAYLREMDFLPDEAIVDRITFSGITSTSPLQEVTVSNTDTGTTLNMAKYTWSKYDLYDLNMPLKSNWEITFERRRESTISPSIQFRYVYPVVDEMVEDVKLGK